jgi:hypothetical protein
MSRADINTYSAVPFYAETEERGVSDQKLFERAAAACRIGDISVDSASAASFGCKILSLKGPDSVYPG